VASVCSQMTGRHETKIARAHSVPIMQDVCKRGTLCVGVYIDLHIGFATVISVRVAESTVSTISFCAFNLSRHHGSFSD